MKKLFPLLSQNELEHLRHALYFLKVGDLKKACNLLAISEDGKKGQLAERIVTYVQSGTQLELKKMPAQSLAKNHKPQPLAPQSLMLHGGYKNDAQTRAFFKKLIGPHFHFTAFGIDWLEERWLAGNPPTYQQFADFWLEENARRKKVKAEPKKEWAYITFLQNMSVENPDATAQELRKAWKNMQEDQTRIAAQLLKKALTKN